MVELVKDPDLPGGIESLATAWIKHPPRAQDRYLHYHEPDSTMGATLRRGLQCGDRRRVRPPVAGEPRDADLFVGGPDLARAGRENDRSRPRGCRGRSSPIPRERDGGAERSRRLGDGHLTALPLNRGDRARVPSGLLARAPYGHLAVERDGHRPLGCIPTSKLPVRQPESEPTDPRSDATRTLKDMLRPGDRVRLAASLRNGALDPVGTVVATVHHPLPDGTTVRDLLVRWDTGVEVPVAPDRLERATSSGD